MNTHSADPIARKFPTVLDFGTLSQTPSTLNSRRPTLCPFFLTLLAFDVSRSGDQGRDIRTVYSIKSGALEK
jgi:hypothetical protein